MPPAHQITDFLCTACGCLCDDLTVTVDGAQITAFEPPCPLAASFLLGESESAPQSAADEPLAASVAQMASLLKAARAPLVMGLHRATVDAQRHAVAIADRLGAWIDPTDERGVSRSHAAVQSLGAVSATLGEVAQRSDLVVYWQCDPQTTHPRHMPRFASRAGRRVVVVDANRTETAAAANEFIELDKDGGFDALTTLRALVRGVEVDAAPALVRLAAALKAARYAAVFYDRNAPEAALTMLMRDLHRTTRAVALPLGGPWNAVGAAQVLTWQTGFPGPVCFARGFPEQRPEGTAERLLANGEVDVALIVGADPLSYVSPAAAAHLRSIPLLVLDDERRGRTSETFRAAHVAVATAPFGLATPGDAYRSDGVALPLRPALPSGAPTAEQVLAALASAIDQH